MASYMMLKNKSIIKQGWNLTKFTKGPPGPKLTIPERLTGVDLYRVDIMGAKNREALRVPSFENH